jgi:hypothetical protein
MRRLLYGLVVVVAIVGPFITAGCERTATLRIVSVNNGTTLRSDVADYYVYFDRVDSEDVILYQFMPDSVEVELQYVEIGAGLPTWTPYEAIIQQATVDFKSKQSLPGEETPEYQKVTVPVDVSVVADPTDKKTTKFYLTAVPAAWKQKVLGDYVQDDQYYTDIIDLADVTVAFSGYDSVADRSVTGTAKFQVEFGNFYDDPSRFGR